ncbi:unnamed protein product [Schistosoma curassoni]|uniref:Uncharacterized protein n=1 Tax=Schistosoma curassoni TaxID=6186 RepID=A0A183L3P9_9TREM|nr:unnamed protein product [Schistosoma curassoni]
MILKYNTENTNPITLDGETLEDIESSTYLGNIIDEQGGSDAYVKVSIGKARATFLQLNNIWNSKQMSVNQYQSHNLQYERQHRQFHCTVLKLPELSQPPSRRYSIYKWLSTEDTQHPLAGYHQ